MFLVWVRLSHIYPPGIIPPVQDVFSAMAVVARDERFLSDLGSTLFRVAGSFLIAMVSGVGLGVLAILLFGMGHGPSFVVGLSAATPIFFFTTVPAVTGIDRRLIEMANAYRVPRGAVLRSVYVPGILLEYGLVRPATVFVKRRLRIDTGDR